MTVESETSGPAVVGGRYRLVARVAGGGMGDVWRARDGRLQRDVAVKVLKSHLADDDIFRKRFRFEARAAAALNHPAIAAVFDYGEEPDSKDGHSAYLVMEFVEGEPLEQLLRRTDRIDAATTLGIVEQTAAGLQAAHDRGIVHRDIKAANLMICPDGAVKITDFGIARALDGTQLTQTGTMLGTVAYMSPEQLAGGTATAKSDLYALGIVAYRCLCGRTPFAGPESMAVALAHVREAVPPLPHDVPVAVAELVYRMLEKDPSDRPASARRLAEDARSVGQSLGSSVLVPATEHDVAPRTRAIDTAPTIAVGRVISSPAGDRTRSMSIATAAYPGVPGIADPADIRLSGSSRSNHRARSRRRWAIVGAAVVVVFAAVFIWGPSGSWAATVPDVHGLPVGAADGRLAALGIRTSDHMVDAAVSTEGTVLTQRPATGVRIPVGSTVVLTVASGFVNVDPAALIGQPVADVDTLLTGLGLHSVSTTVISVDAPGTVVSVDPSGPVRTGSTVTVAVAAAPPPTTTTTNVPVLKGKGGRQPGGGGGGGPGGSN
jgi:eukaryotic-like serine/threonine-protein kinase